MLKKAMLCLFAAILLVAMALPVSAMDEDCLLDLDFGNKNWSGDYHSEDTLPLPDDYTGNFTLELYVKINDFDTPTVIAGSWAIPLSAHAIWCNSGKLYFAGADTGGNNNQFFDTDLTSQWKGKWLHLVGVKNGAVNTFYCSPEGSDEYESISVDRTNDHTCAIGNSFIVNGADTEFEGAGNFVLGTVRLFETDRSDFLLDMKDECAARVAEAGEEQAADPADPTEKPAADPTEEPTAGSDEEPDDSDSSNVGSSNAGNSNASSGKRPNAQTFDLGIVSLAAVALSSVVAIKKRK